MFVLKAGQLGPPFYIDKLYIYDINISDGRIGDLVSEIQEDIMKQLVLALSLGTILSSAAHARGYCDPISYPDRLSIGTFCSPVTPYGRHNGGPRRGNGYARGSAGLSVGIVIQKQAPRRKVWIPQDRPSGSAYRCVQNGVPGWCVD